MKPLTHFLVMYLIFLGLGLTLGCSQRTRSPIRPDAPINEGVTAGLVEAIPRLMERAGVPGLSLAVVTEGSIWAHAFGYASAEAKLPATVDTIFEAASMSKPVFAYAVLKMREKGLLDLDTPLMSYAPGPYMRERFLRRRLADERLGLITARMVLSHTSGIPHALPEDANLSLLFGPGSQFTYSDEGFNFLQKVVEHITGRSLNEFMTAYVFRPLGMGSSSYVWREEFEPRIALGHDAGGTAQPIWKEAHGSAASTLYTTPRDYGTFMLAVLRRHGLREDTFAEMLRPQVATTISDTPPVSWGLGVGLHPTESGDVFWQWGDNDVFRGYMAGLAGGRTGLVFFTNSANGLKVTEQIVERVIRGRHPTVRNLGYQMLCCT